jgi:ABC-type sugar transport system permease subunit
MNVQKRKGNLLTRNDWRGYVFIAPVVILFIVFLFTSIGFIFKNSVYRLTLTLNNPQYVGADNFKYVLEDSSFWRSLGNNVLLGGFTVFVSMTLGYLVSVFLMFQFKGKRILHGLFFFPTMIPMALLATVFSTMLEYKSGMLNELLRSVGLGALASRWLVDPILAKASVLSISIFLIGLAIIYYSAGISTINQSVFEAALIDGANMRHMLFMIMYPLLKNTHYTVALSIILSSFREFERVYLLTNGGPGGSTNIVGTYIFNFSRSAGSNIGMVCAASIIILIVAFAISFAQIMVSRRLK